MKNSSRLALILFIIGVIMVSFSWPTGLRHGLYLDKNGVHLQGVQTKTISHREPFSSLQIDAQNIRVEVVSADYYGLEINYVNAEPVWSINNGLLSIRHHPSNASHFFNFSLNFAPREFIRVYVPAPVETIDISNANGSIHITDTSASAVLVANKNGSINLQSVTSPHMTLVNKNGSIKAENIIATNLSAENKNGSIAVSGDLSGHNKFENKNGSIKLHLARRDYAYDLQTTHGSIRLAGERQGSVFRQGDFSAPDTISAQNANGSIAIDYFMGL